MWERWLKTIWVLTCVLMLAVALWLLHDELRTVHYKDVVAAMRAVPTERLGLAVLLTLLSYLTLTTYDFFALRYAGKPLPLRKTFLASFIAYVFSHNLGSILGSAAVRYRLYSAFELSALDIAKVVVFCAVTFWLGLLGLGGVVFLAAPPEASALANLSPAAYRAIGAVLVLLAGCYVAATRFRRRPLRFGRWKIAMPSPMLAFAQIAVSTTDWLLASAVLYALLPVGVPISYGHFIAIYVLASIISVVSHVPGGLGVLESVVLVSLASFGHTDEILASLLLYRIIYYLVPLGCAVLLLGVFETANAKHKLVGFTTAAGKWLPLVVPRLFSVLAFGLGVMLLFSGVTPAVHERLNLLDNYVPLGFLEASHLFASLVGVALLLVARGLQKRMDAAYHLTVALMAAGIVFSLLKGFDYEEALFLALAMAVLVPCRSYFYRKASLFEARFTPAWVAAITMTLAAMVWLMIFVHKHVEYSNSLWWTFAFQHGGAPRSLRAAFVAVTAALVVGLTYLLRPPAAPRTEATPLDVEADVAPLVRNAEKTYACLALTGDKRFLFNERKTAFVMYGAEGRSFVALGDPVGTEEEVRELIWSFRDLCDRGGHYPAFYQIGTENLHYYVDAGFALLKLGEEAVVTLAGFTLEGKARKAFRNTVNKLGKDGYAFEVAPREAVPSLLAQLQAISDAWLATKKVREKRFSLGAFSPDYLRRFPVAIVRKGERIVAFANLWETTSGKELSVDLMRYVDDAPNGVMDFLFVSIMLWGKAHGYQTFNLGMAPFSGMERRPLAPLWSKLGSTLYRYGENFYNFQGVREYKEKFDPIWQPKYLASPGGLALPTVLTNVATLISGGVKGVLGK